MIKKADIVLGLVLIALGIIGSLALVFSGESGQSVVVSVDGEEYGKYSLLDDRTVVIKKDNRINKITIKDGGVSMVFSNCPGQDCVHRGGICKASESIVCLPNKVVVEVEGQSTEYDAISN